MPDEEEERVYYEAQEQTLREALVVLGEIVAELGGSVESEG